MCINFCYISHWPVTTDNTCCSKICIQFLCIQCFKKELLIKYTFMQHCPWIAIYTFWVDRDTFLRRPGLPNCCKVPVPPHNQAVSSLLSKIFIFWFIEHTGQYVGLTVHSSKVISQIYTQVYVVSFKKQVLSLSVML